MVVAWKGMKWLGMSVAGLMAGCATLVPVPVEYLDRDPPPGTIPYGEKRYVDDGQCPAGQVKQLIGGDAKKNIPRQVECVPRPQ